MPNARSARLLVVLVVLLVGAAGVSLRWWGTEPVEPTLRVGIGPWIGYEPFVAARESGHWPEGLRLVELESNTEAIDAFVEGRIDVAGLTLDESLRLAREGSRHTLIAVLSDSHGGDAVLGRATFDDVADLAGQTVLVEDTAVGQLMLGAALDAAGVPRDAVKTRRVQATRLPIAWANGEAAGVVAYSPLIERLEADGATVLFSTRDHPGLVLDVLVLREGLPANSAAVRRLLAAWDAGRRQLEQNDPTLIDALARGLGMSPEAYRAALSNVMLMPSAQGRAMLVGQPPPVLASIERVERLFGGPGPRPRLADGAGE